MIGLEAWKIGVIAAVLALTMALGMNLGSRWTQAKWDAEKVEMQKVLLAKAEAEAEAAREGAEFRKKLGEQEIEIGLLHDERKRNAKRTVVNRKCLDAGTVGMLNGRGSGLSVPRGASETPSESAGETAASDGDVVDWIGEANERYEVCAGRLNGLIDELSGESEDVAR